MSMLATPKPTSWPMPPFPVYRFTVDDYHRMTELGVLTENDDVELLEGWVTPKMPQNIPHQTAIELVPEVLRPSIPNGWRIRAQLPIATADSEPEPDFAIVRGPILQLPRRVPSPADVGLLIEVSDSSLDHDRNDKGRIYARAAIGCYWIINLVDRQIEVYTDPTGPDPAPHYRRRQDYVAGDSVPLTVAGQPVGSVAVNDLLPPP